MNTMRDWFFEHIEHIRALIDICQKCDSDGKHRCPNCLNMIAPYCPNCLDNIADGQGNCPKCYALATIGCDICNHTGYVPCKECNEDGYIIVGYELDGKRAESTELLWRKFNPIVKNRVGEIVRFIANKDGYDVVIDRNNQADAPFGTLQVSATGWTFEVNGKAYVGKIEDEFLDNALNVIFELYCEVGEL